MTNPSEQAENKPLSVVVIGSGQLATALTRQVPPGVQLIHVDRRQLDLSDAAAVEAWGNAHLNDVDVVINTAAVTRVDDCEDVLCEAAEQVNGVAPGILARAATQAGAVLIHVSTDYVFGSPVAGEDLSGLPEAGSAEFLRGYPVDAATRPVSVYGTTKHAGEQAVLAAGDQHLVVRTAWLYSAEYFGQPGNPDFVSTMLRLARTGVNPSVVDDQWGSPTSAISLARVLWQLAVQQTKPDEQRPRGVFHAAGATAATWYDFAQAIFAAAGCDPARVSPTPSSGYPQKAPRPAYSVLDSRRLDDYGIEPPEGFEKVLHAHVAAAPPTTAPA